MSNSGHDDMPKIEYFFTNPIQLRYMQRYAEAHPEDYAVVVIPTDTPEEVQAAADEWSRHEKQAYHDDEDAFDNLRRLRRRSYEKLLQEMPVVTATHFLVKEVQRNQSISTYHVLSGYYEPRCKRPADELEYSEMVADLYRIFGEDGMERLTYQIAHDDPSLSKIDVVRHAWHYISEATAYMMPAFPEDLTKHAILIHEGYEAQRRISG